MILGRFDDFVRIFLVNASQMAYIEEAEKTHAMLQKFSELHRYMIKSGYTSTLGEELKAARSYLEIQTSVYEGRFSFSIENCIKNMDVNIKHLSLLDFIEEIMSNALSGHENRFSLAADLKEGDGIRVTAAIEAGGSKETFGVTLAEEER